MVILQLITMPPHGAEPSQLSAFKTRVYQYGSWLHGGTTGGEAEAGLIVMRCLRASPKTVLVFS